MSQGKKHTIKDFWDRVNKNGPNGCWEWTALKDADGYGLFCFESKRYSAHRFVYKIRNITIPQGHFILHSCDNPCCCNPDHLRIGTVRDNVTDAMNRNRLKGNTTRERPYGGKGIPQELRDQIKNDSGTHRELGKKYNLDPKTIKKYRSH